MSNIVNMSRIKNSFRLALYILSSSEATVNENNKIKWRAMFANIFKQLLKYHEKIRLFYCIAFLCSMTTLYPDSSSLLVVQSRKFTKKYTCQGNARRGNRIKAYWIKTGGVYEKIHYPPYEFILGQNVTICLIINQTTI